VSVQRLDRTLTAYRIGDAHGEHPLFSAMGSVYYPGRWNDADTPVVYASEHYSTAMLEKLVQAAGLMPPDQHFIEVTLPPGLSFEMVTKDMLPGWDTAEPGASRDYGVEWVEERRTAILLVPSIPARIERNVVINPAHPEFDRIEHGLPQPVWWDGRLFGAEPG